MLRTILTITAIAITTPAFADPYATTLSDTEKERHEFYDTQRENYPSGPTTIHSAPTNSWGSNPLPTTQSGQTNAARPTTAGTTPVARPTRP